MFVSSYRRLAGCDTRTGEPEPTGTPTDSLSPTPRDDNLMPAHDATAWRGYDPEWTARREFGESHTVDVLVESPESP